MHCSIKKTTNKINGYFSLLFYIEYVRICDNSILYYYVGVRILELLRWLTKMLNSFLTLALTQKDKKN